jgi:tape measure domain-containing protein
MYQSINMTICGFERMQESTGKSIKVKEFESAKNMINDVGSEIRLAEEQQERFNNKIRNGKNNANGLLRSMKQMVGVYALINAGKKVLNLSDEMTSTNARLKLMNEMNGSLQTTKELQEMIMQSAKNSRAEYTNTAATVSKLGILAKDAFSSNAEIITFTEQMNKQFKIGGASVQEQKSAMLQLTQAMAAGKLQGDEFRSIMENAPLLAQSIAEYIGKSVGELKEMSSKGKITADIIKNAMLASAEETNRRFEQLPMTFAEVGTALKNDLLQTFQPVIEAIGRGAQVIHDNWSTIEPIFWGLTAAVGAYAIMMGVKAAATWLAVAANRALITTMLSNPLLWVALTIGVLIGMIYKWVKSVGGLKIAWMIAMNKIMTAFDCAKIGFFVGIYWILDLWDKLKIGIMKASTGIQNFVGDMKVGVLTSLQSMVNDAIGIINGFIKTLNKIPGVSIGAIQEVTFGTNAKLKNEAAKQARQEELNKYESMLNNKMADRDRKLNQMKVDAVTSNKHRQVEIKSLHAQNKASNNHSNDLGTQNNPIYATAKVDDTVDISSEDLKTMRDLAEAKAIQSFVTLTPKVEVTTGDINNGTDLDDVVGRIVASLDEEISVNAKGAFNV